MSKCGCEIVEGECYDGEDRYIAYCPLHAAAGELLEVLKQFDALESDYNPGAILEAGHLFIAARTAIKKASS